MEGNDSRMAAGTGKEDDFAITIFPSVQENIDNIKNMLNSPVDLVSRTFKVGQDGIPCGIVFIDALVNSLVIDEAIIKHVQRADLTSTDNKEAAKGTIYNLVSTIVSASEISTAQTLDKVTLNLLSGDTALFIEGLQEVILIDNKYWAERPITEPEVEQVVRGPRSGFNENIRTNLATIRREFRDPNLQMISLRIGRRSKKELLILYIAGIANPKLIAEAEKRVRSIDIDDAPDSGYIEQWIEDSFLTPFPQIHNTERPDLVMLALTEGRIVILLDGTPQVLIAPATISSLLRSPEDYYERWLIGTLIRILRYTATFIAIFLPSLYIALIEYHQGMIPSKLAFTIASYREGVPFPAVVEAFSMEFTMEMLREAGLRLPSKIGQTIGIVGGLVIGEAAVSAGVVSPIMVIVVALTAISSFAIPTYSFSISLRILRFAAMAAASVFGLYGVILMFVMICIHITNLTSFGVPYSTPFIPNFKQDWTYIIRLPLTMVRRRPEMMKPVDKVQYNKGDKP